MAATVNRISDQWLEERNQAPLDKVKDWVREFSAPIVDAVQERMGVVHAGKHMLDEGGEAAELRVLAKKLSCDAVNADDQILGKIRNLVATYQDAAQLLHSQTDGLGNLGWLADSYVERAAVYSQVLATLPMPPEQPPMTNVEWDATKFVQLRQAKAQLGFQPSVGGPASGRHGRGFFLCMEDNDFTPVGANAISMSQSSSMPSADRRQSVNHNNALLPDAVGSTPATPIRTSIRAPATSETHDECIRNTYPFVSQTRAEYTVTPTFEDLAGIPAAPTGEDPESPLLVSSRQVLNLPRGAVIDEATVNDSALLLQSAKVGTKSCRHAAKDAARDSEDLPHQDELMEKLEKEFQMCSRPKDPRPRPQPMLDDAISKDTSSSQLSSPSYAHSNKSRSPRGLSPGGYATRDAEKQAASRRKLQESRRCGTPPRPPRDERSKAAATELTLENAPSDALGNSSLQWIGPPTLAALGSQGEGTSSTAVPTSRSNATPNVISQGLQDSGSSSTAALGSRSNSTRSVNAQGSWSLEHLNAAQASWGSARSNVAAQGPRSSMTTNMAAQSRLLGVVGGESNLEPRYVSAGGAR